VTKRGRPPKGHAKISFYVDPALVDLLRKEAEEEELTLSDLAARILRARYRRKGMLGD